MKRSFLIDGRPVEVEVERLEGGMIRLESGGRNLEVRGEPLGGGWWRLESPDGAVRRAWVGEADPSESADSRSADIWSSGSLSRVQPVQTPKRSPGPGRVQATGGPVSRVPGIGAPGSAPMPGVVVRMLEPGTVVEKGAVVASITAMKMEHAIRAPWPARVVRQCAAVGKSVAKGAILVELEQIHDV